MGLAIHTFTALGAITGILALEAVYDGKIRRALVWLVVCQILDGVDGPLARKAEVGRNAPHIDGHILDLVVDYRRKSTRLNSSHVSESRMPSSA